MCSRLPKRHNVEPVFRIVSQLFAGQTDLSSSSGATDLMGDFYHTPADTIDSRDDAFVPAKKFHKRRAQRKARAYGAVTHSGTIVNRSKSVDDLTAADIAIESDSDEDPISKSHTAIISQEGKSTEKIIHSKDQQIAKLIKKLTAVFECNNQFAVEHEKLQKEYQQAVQNLRTLETIQAKSCDRCASSDAERCQLVKENSDLRNDIKMMKILVYRLNVQIERYQDTIRDGKTSIPKLDFVDSTYGGAKDNLNWGPVNSHTLGPLLNAYEEAIAEKTDLVQQYESELASFTGKLKKVLEENEALQKMTEEVRAGQTGWATEKARLQAQVDVLRSKAEVQGKRADLAKEKLVEVLKCYEQKVQAQNLDIERLQEAYSRSKGELTSLRNLNQNPEVVADSLKECQKLLEELRLQHHNERSRSAKETETIKADFQQKTAELEQLRQDYQQQQHIYERQKEINEILMGKNTTLKQTLERTRQSKEILKQRLKTMISWGKGSEQRKDQLQDAWQNIRTLQEQLQQRDLQLQTLHQRFQQEQEQLQRRLRQREDTLRKILADKAQFTHRHS
ncbi:protein Cep89 homolog [Anopheles maculipalpis]|uniref:protein Cep89 homolog n=1 Tax=Anopheles maculipalpis TaxID=1496333 RepID=UPI002158B942|nr:protein Cep89 homolog [Anopheles maculipalpis]